MEEQYICKFCGRVCKNANSLRNHERLCKENPDRDLRSIENLRKGAYEWQLNHAAWNKGLTKETDERLKKASETYNNNFKAGLFKASFKGKRHTEEYKAYMSEVAKRRHLGGWHTSKSIEYNGVILDSEYEFCVAKELDENNIKWERPSPLLWKDENLNEHRYYPDFYLPEYNVYLDPKNDYLINNKSKRFGITDVEKIDKVEKQNGIKIVILDKNNLTWQKIKEKI